MKRTATRLQDKEGNVYKWTFWYMSAINLTLGRKPRIVHGWAFTDHEGYERFCEGNWIDFVPYFRMIADNYGLVTTLS